MRRSQEPTNPALVRLAHISLQILTQGAMQYASAHDLIFDADTLAKRCIEKAKAALPKAMEDVAEAFDLGMHQVGEATFIASMTLAGAEAAKEVSSPRVPA